MAGRPTEYKEEYNELAEKACKIFGADDKKLAKFLEVCKSTITTWKKKHPEFLASIKKGKDFYDTNEVEGSLLRRALGYKVTETHKVLDEKTGEIITKEVIKHVVSDTAILFWLKNRNPKRWRDIKAMEITGRDGRPLQTQQVPIDFSNLTSEELAMIEQIWERINGANSEA
ncbi:MAG: helix-turn-helix domain-containing protein [Methylococcaceae bacterium]